MKWFLIALMVSVQAAFATDLSISEFGAIGDGRFENKHAIQSAIDAVHDRGGGRVIVPEGVFVTGTIQIKSNVTLHLEGNAELKGSPTLDEHMYPKISPGYESFVARPDVYPERVLIYAKNAKNVGLSGSGTINGNGGVINNFEGRDWQKNRLKCVNLIRFIKCKHVKIHGEGREKMLLVRNSGHWAVQPMNCDHVHIRYLRVEEYGGVTPDGLPISDCRDVLVEDCYISADDDALGLKNGSPEILVRDITVKRTIFESGNTGFKSGSPQSFGRFTDVKFIGCTFRRVTDPESKKNYGHHHGFFVGILNGGGSYDRVLIEDCIIENTRMPFAMYVGRISQGYWKQWWQGRDAANEYGSVKNIVVRNVSYRNPDSYGVLIEGRKGYEIENITLENVYLPSKGGEGKKAIPEEKVGSYPNMSNTYSRLPAYGFFIRNARNVTMKNVWCWTQAADQRPCLLTSNVTGLDSSGLHEGKMPGNYVPAVSFDLLRINAVDDVFINANARDHDGEITKVELFVNGRMVGEEKVYPYEWDQTRITHLVSGKNTFVLKAFDDKGATSTVEKSVELGQK